MAPEKRYTAPRRWPLYTPQQPDEWVDNDPDPQCAHDWARVSTTEWQCPRCLTIRRLRPR